MNTQRLFPPDESTWKTIAKYAEVLIKPICQMADDIAAAVKNDIPIGTAGVGSIVGGAFGLVCLLEIYDSLKELSKDYKDFQDEAIGEEDHIKIRMAKHSKTLAIASGGLGLSIGLIIGATTSLSVVGAAFFPFAIMAALTLDAVINFYHAHWECQKIEKEISDLQQDDPLIAEKTKTLNEALKHAKTKRNAEALETIGSILVTASLAIASFTAFLAASTATMGILPLALAIVGLGIIIVAKIYEKKHEVKKDEAQPLDKPEDEIEKKSLGI